MSDWPGGFEVRKKPHYKAKHITDGCELADIEGYLLRKKINVNLIDGCFIKIAEYWFWFTSNGNIYFYTLKQ